MISSLNSYTAIMQVSKTELNKSVGELDCSLAIKIKKSVTSTALPIDFSASFLLEKSQILQSAAPYYR